MMLSTYCPEIALFHGTCALIQKEISSGKYDLSSCSKENFPARPLELVIEILDEIISGPNYPRSTPERETWNKNFHHLFFYKTFMFNCNSFHNSLTNHKLCSYLETYCGWCKKIPNFNPIFYFSLSEKYGWIDFLTYTLFDCYWEAVDSFMVECIKFCSDNPPRPFDFYLIDTSLGFLMFAYIAEFTHLKRLPFFRFQSQCPVPTHDCDIKNSDVCDDDNSSERMVVRCETTVDEDNFEASLNEAHSTNGDDLAEDLSGQSSGNRDDFNETEVFQTDTVRMPSSREGSSDVTAHLQTAAFFTAADMVEPEKASSRSVHVDLLLTEQCDGIGDTSENGDVALRCRHCPVLQENRSYGQIRSATFMQYVVDWLKIILNRMSVKLFDKPGDGKVEMLRVLRTLGKLFSSVVLVSLFAFMECDSNQLRQLLQAALLNDREDDGGPSALFDADTDSKCEQSGSRTFCGQSMTDRVCQMVRRFEVKMLCFDCLCSFFTVHSTATETSLKQLSFEKSGKLGRVVRHRLMLHACDKSLDMVSITGRLCDLSDMPSVLKDDERSDKLIVCLEGVVQELKRKQELDEERKLNPTLEEVRNIVEKRHTGWKCMYL